MLYYIVTFGYLWQYAQLFRSSKSPMCVRATQSYNSIIEKCKVVVCESQEGTKYQNHYSSLKITMKSSPPYLGFVWRRGVSVPTAVRVGQVTLPSKPSDRGQGILQFRWQSSSSSTLWEHCVTISLARNQLRS